jgi:A/G-specific adenine glycosylase
LTQLDPKAVAPLLLAWYGKAGRDLPWRRTRDPYRVWLSEIMLQQTGVVAVIPYYERFLGRFSDVAALAAAPVEEVVELWAGLGYYSRARNLHAAARQVVEVHGGRFPQSLQELTALPGIGRSTAGAILSIAFDIPAPLLDGNVRRVLCRLFAWQDDPRSSAAEKQLWRWAEALTPAERPHDYAQAIMDLGATLCTPRSPACERCPLESLCRARALGLEEEVPRRRVKAAVPTRIQVALLLERDGRFLVCRRPLSGMLGGLWEFPGAPLDAGEAPAQLAARLQRELGGGGEAVFAGGVDHAYSHFKLDLHLYRLAAPALLVVAEGIESRWLTPAELADFPLHGAHRKALALL